jgi:hypothetical protein
MEVPIVNSQTFTWYQSHLLPKNTSMCLAPSSAAIMTNPLAGASVGEKLTRTNYLLWQSQILPPIRGARLLSFLDPKTEAPPETIVVQKDGKEVKEENHAYDAWVATDQQVPSFILNSLTPDISVSVIGMDTAA